MDQNWYWRVQALAASAVRSTRTVSASTVPGRDVQINLHAALVERNVPRSSSSGDRFVDRVRNIETGGFVEFSMMEGISSGAAADVSVLLCQKRPDRERPEELFLQVLVAHFRLETSTPDMSCVATRLA